MTDKAWKVSHKTWCFFRTRYYGAHLSLLIGPTGDLGVYLILNLGTHNHCWTLRKEYLAR